MRYCDEQLVHELTWAAEAVINMLSRENVLIPISSIHSINELKRWIDATRSEWAVQDDDTAKSVE